MHSMLSNTLRRSGVVPLLRPAGTIPFKTVMASLRAQPTTIPSQPPQSFFMIVRSKHSNTQIKRLFKNHPARQRVHERLGMIPMAQPPPTRTYEPAIEAPEILSNGWTPPPTVPVPDYPFRVARTKNKPNDAVGFLPVYSKMRKDGTLTVTRIKKVSGDRDAFIQELRATLEIPIPHNPVDDVIRVRTGGTIEVKGNHVRPVRTWLASLGF